MRHRPIEGQLSLLDELFAVPVPAPPIPDAKPVVAEKPKKIIRPKVLAPLPLTDNPTVTFHKGGGKIIISPNDVIASLRMTEIRNLNPDHLIWKDSNGIITGKIEVVPGVDSDSLSMFTKAWTIIGPNFDNHPMVRILRSYGLEVRLSTTLSNWMKKEAKRMKREGTPLLLPEYADTRVLFEKVEAGMVLQCHKDFTIDTEAIFTKGGRYQVVDTARNGTDGVVKIFKQAIVPGVKIMVTGPDVFEWTAFHGAMEDVFEYQERVIYDPSKCVPEQYPVLYANYQKKLEQAKLQLFDHTMVDLPQMATKRDIADLKLMRMGKFQPTYSKILTPTGWKLMGDMKVGDLVFGSDGNSYPVSAIYPQGKKPVYKVTFTDGSSTECGMSHLWQVNTPERKHSGRPPRVLKLKEIANKLVDTAGNTQYYIPIAEPFNFPAQDLPLDPYLLGCLLRDGRHGSKDKFIPEIYKFSSITQRLRLLAGLLDTDGSASKQKSNNSASSNEYTSVSERLCDDVQFLIESLGGNAVKSSRIPTYTYKGKKLNGQRAYRLRFSFGPGMNPFLLERKADIFKPCTKFLPTRGIISIEYIGKKPCQCITVNSPDGLYATDHCILTHNTREAAGLVWLWGSKRCAWIGPRNARIFTERELDALSKQDPAFGKYVVVDKPSDMDKDGLFYLLTYSWLKKQDDPQRQARRQGKTWLNFIYKEKGSDKINEHKCPHCGQALYWPYIHKIYSSDLLTEKKHLLSKSPIEWRKDPVEGCSEGSFGYVCINSQCVRTYENNNCKGAAWYTKKPIKVKGTAIPLRDEKGEIVYKDGKPEVKTLNYWADINLKAHMKCKEKHIKGRMCTKCGQFDGTWTPPLYKRIKDSFSSVVVDEIHTIKSADSDIGKAVRTFRGKHHVGLTGTLIPNTPSDAHYPLYWNFHGGSASFPYDQGQKGAIEFYNQFCEYVTYKRGSGMKDARKMLPYLKNPIQFWELMAPKMVRRSYEDPLVLSSMEKLGLHIPKMIPHRVMSQMNPIQAALIIASINHFENQFNELQAEATQSNHMVNPALVISQMSRIRIAATCPEHFNKVIRKMNLSRKPEEQLPPLYTGPLGGGKMADIKNLVMQKTMNGKKVVILSGFIAMRESCAIELAHYNPIVFNGQWDDEERAEAFDAFRDDPDRKIWIAGTMEIREGVDLSAADTVICTDLLWQPGLQAQAWSRALTPTKEDRICNVYLLVAENTIDEHIYNTFYAKVAAAEQALDRKVINIRANAVDIKWFVERILNDRGKILDMVGREQGEELIMIPDSSFLAFEERSL